MMKTMKDLFSPEQFTATKFTTAEQKAKFANHFVRFVDAGFPKTLFVKWFYNELRNCFGHIAHFDINGFYEEWFSSTQRKLDFIKNVLNHTSYGDPAHTFSDVEKELYMLVHLRGYVVSLTMDLTGETAKKDLAEFRRLLREYPEQTYDILKTCEDCKPPKRFRTFTDLETHMHDDHGLVP